MGCEASAVALPLQGCGDARRQPAVRADAGEIRQTPPLNASFAEPLARTPPTPGRHRPAAVMQRRGRLLLALALLLPLALLLAAAGLLALVPAREAIVPRTDALEMRDVERALQLARQHDPRRAIPGVVRVLRLSQHEAELLINHAAARVRPGRWALALGADRLQLRGSLRLPDNPLGNWVNVELQARQTPGLPQLEAVKVGPLSLPLPLVQWLLDLAIEHQGLGGWRAVGAVAVQQVRLLPRRIDIVYAWGPDAPARVLATLLPVRASASSLYRPIRSASGVPLSAASVADTSRCCGKSLRPARVSRTGRAASSARRSGSSVPRPTPLDTRPSTISAARFSSAGSSPAALRAFASSNIGGSTADSGCGAAPGAAAASAARWAA